MQSEASHPTSRRGLLLAPLLTASLATIAPARRAHAAPALQGIPQDRRLAFDVLRNGSPIGTHVLSFTPDNDRLTIAIAVHIAAGLGPLTLYRYEMTGTEIWQNGQFVGLDTTTNNDGAHHVVSIRRTAAGLHVQSTQFATTTLAENTLPLTHWNEAALSGPLLSPEDGQVMKAVVTPAGSRTITLANGQAVSATGYGIKAKTPIFDWYDASRTWVGLHADATDGSDIDYKRK